MSAASSVSWAFLLSAAVISVASSVGAVTNDMEDVSSNSSQYRYIQYQTHAPRITHPPRDQKVLDNTIVSFQCLAAGNPIPEVYWKRAGRRIVAPSPPAASASASGITGGGTGTHTSGGSTGNRPRHFVIPVPHGSVLRIDPAKARRDDGMVECVAENGVGEPAVAQATLEVHADGVAPPGYPRIVEGPSLKAVEKDRSTVMICSAIGNPEPTVTWYKDYVPVDLMDPRLKILPTGSLQIRHSLESDEGKYECVAENHIGVAFSYGANLYVRVRRVPPHFSVPPESVEVMPGGSVNLTCVAIGSPMPEVRWRLGAVDLTPEQSAPVGKNVLMLNDVRDSATYTCVAASELGNIEYDAEVRVKALPRAPTSLVVTDVAADYVRLSWNSGNVETIPSYVVQFRPKYPTSSSSSSSGISNVAIDDVSLSESFREVTDVRQTEFQVRGLLPFTVYEMRVMAVNGVGRSLPSASVDVTTAELAPGSPPINVKARPVSSSATFVQWDEPQNPNGVIRGYKVYYTLSPDLPVNLWTVHPVDGVTELTTITNLLTNRSYTIRVLGYTNVGDGPLSESVQVKMLPGVLYQEGVFDIPEQPTNLQGEPTSPNTIQLTWDAPDMSPDDVIDSYELYYNDSHFRQNIRVTISPPRNTYLLEDLTPDTVYHVRVAARSARGEGASTPTVQVRTPEFVPGEPRRVKVEPYNSTAVTVQWRPPADAEQNGIIRGYRIHYVQLSGLEVDDNSETMVPVSPQHVAKTVDVSDTSRTELIVGGLQPDTAYQFQVAGFTRKGEGDRTKPRKVKTKGAVPSPPRGLQLSLTQEDPPVVTLTWSTPRHTHGNVEGYKLLYGVKGEYTVEERRFDGDKMRFTTGFLERGVEYEFRVAAKNGVDFGEAASETFRTPDGIPGAAPQNFTAIGLSSTSVKLQWDPPPKRLRNGEIIMYEVVYRRRGNELEDLAANSTEPWLLIEGLEVNSDYVFQLRAYTSRGCGPWSNRLPFRTFGNHILPAPTNVQLRRVSPTTIEISWDSPRYPGVSGYRVYYRPTSQYGVLPLPGAGAEGPVTEQGIEVTVDTALDGSWLNKEIGPYTSTELSGLEPGVIYAVKVRAKTADGRLGNLSEAVWTRRRDSDHPDVVQDFHVKSLDARSATFEWKPPRTVGVFRYKLEYEGIRQTRDPDTVIENTLIDPRKDQMVVKEQRSLYIDNLLPRTMYTFNISALFINGDWGPPVSLRVETSQEAPSAVEPPRLLPFHEDGTVTVKLSPSQNEALADVTHYLVIVVPEELARRKLPNDFRLEDLDTRPVDHFDGKMTSRGPTAWIAARYEVNSLPSEMILGDGTWPGSGHYFNRKLPFSGGRMNGFRVFVRAMTANNKPTSSAYSERLVLPPDGIPESQVVIESERGSSSFNLLAVVAPICATIVLALLLALVVIVARKRRTAWKSTPSLPQTTKITPRVNHCSEVVSFTVTAQPVDPVEMRRLQYPTQVLRNHPPIPIQEFVAHVIQCKMNEGARFSAEYESIDPGGCGGPAGSPTTINRRAPASFGTSSSSNNPPLTWEASSAEVNKSKNRYANVVAYDHSRVRLVTGSGSVTAESGDYINANFVDGYRRPGAYIATQGPLPDTFTDFWRMVWDHRCSGIVMMTKLEERSRIKCDQYWPSRAMETYGSVHVTPVDVLELASYTIRTFQLTRDGRDERREIRQFQFTAWPDHGVPVHPTPLLLFMRRVKFMTNQDSGPLVVHCSAGVGRTGVFIAIDSQLERIRHVPTIDIYGQVTLMRSQRNYMVQTEDQYVFAHDALVEAVQSGNTEVPTRSLLAHVHRLSERIPNCGGQVSSTTCGANSPAPAETGMALEFRRLTCLKTGANPELFVSANLPCNKSKNRLVNVLPLEATRVLLQPIRGVEGSDYINANYIDGYRSKRAYIATQGPLAETTEEFWRMLWENNCNIVVMLTKLCELGREKCYQYWPNDRSARYQYFVVDPLAEYNMPHYILREFKVTDARDGQSRTLRQFQFTDWPEQGVPPSGEGFIELIGQVHKTKEQFGQEGPITVHCSAGVGRTGVFITLSIVLERMKYEAVIDMFQTVNMLRTQRPLLVQSEDQYSFCYRAMLEYIGSYDQRYVS